MNSTVQQPTHHEGAIPALTYVWDRLLPTDGTDAEQALHTIAALSRLGVRVRLRLPVQPQMQAPTAAWLQQHYQVQGNFEVETVAVPRAGLLSLHKLLYPWRALPPGGTGHEDTTMKSSLIYTRNSQVMLRGLRRGYRVVYDTHRAWPDHLPATRPWFRWAMQHPNFVGALLHSHYARDSYLRLGIDSERLLVAHNGYDPQRFATSDSQEEARRQLGLPLGVPIAVYAGHLGAFKGTYSLLQVARLSQEAQRVQGCAPSRQLRLLLVGARGHGWVEALARRTPGVELVGWQPYDRAALYLRAADVLLLPPSAVPLRIAGHTVLPMKIYGYLAAGRAIIGPATSDLQEVLHDGVNARLVKPGDTTAMTTILHQLLDDPATRQSLAAAAQGSAAELTWEARAQRILAFLSRRLAPTNAR